MRTLTIILCLALAQCGLSPAWADPVTLPEAPPPAVEPGGPDASDLAASAPISTDLAMLYHVPADGDSPLYYTPAASPAVNLMSLQAGSGADTRIGVDLAAANASSDGWPWYAKAAVVVGCVVVAGLATWAIVEACDGGSHDHDYSEHTTIGVSGSGNTVNIHHKSPEFRDNSNRSTDNSNRSTDNSDHSTGGYE